MAPISTQAFFGIQEQITLTKNGVWLSNGEEITHPGTLNAFNKNIYKTDNGFEIRLGAGEKQERKEITVEDTMYFVVSLSGNEANGYLLKLNDGRTVALDPQTLKYSVDRLTCKVLNPHQNTQEEAKFLTHPYHEILKDLKADGNSYTLTIQGKTINL